MTPQRAARVSAHTTTHEWWTPLHVLEPLGQFDLDPCAPKEEPDRTGAARWYTSDDDGLAQPWTGRVWLNPPYANAGEWIARLAAHGDGIGLVFARTETGWFHEHVWEGADAVLFLRGRLSFIDGLDLPRARKGHNAAAPSVMVAYGPRNAAVLRSCGLAGAYVPLQGADVHGR